MVGKQDGKVNCRGAVWTTMYDLILKFIFCKGFKKQLFFLMKIDIVCFFRVILKIVVSKDVPKYKNLKNWSCAIGYGVGSGSPLSPSFNFGLELSRNSQV